MNSRLRLQRLRDHTLAPILSTVWPNRKHPGSKTHQHQARKAHDGLPLKAWPNREGTAVTSPTVAAYSVPPCSAGAYIKLQRYEFGGHVSEYVEQVYGIERSYGTYLDRKVKHHVISIFPNQVDDPTTHKILATCLYLLGL